MPVTLTKEPTSLERYATPGERRVTRKLCYAALDMGYTLSVWDGEEWTLTHAWRLRDVLAALCTTGMDVVRINHAHGPSAGRFWLVWGNAEDGSELIADHTDNDLCTKLCAIAYGEDAQ